MRPRSAWANAMLISEAHAFHRVRLVPRQGRLLVRTDVRIDVRAGRGVPDFRSSISAESNRAAHLS